MFCLAVIAALPLSAQETKRAEVLVLGVFHMANPGHDVFNTQVDDVRVPKRQQEIEVLMAALQKFQPTKIAVENDSQKRLDERYAKYLAGQYELTTNEIDQIGLRLAKASGHKTIYAVDADGDFPWMRLIDYGKATGQSAKIDAIVAEVGEGVKSLDSYLKAHTILETLLYVNSDARVARDVGFYYREAHFGEPGDYAGPDLLAEWYKRNIRIFNNVTKLIASPDDRILLIYGYGHLGWLQQDVENDPTLRLRKLAEFAH
jgi:hypothetical protein